MRSILTRVLGKLFQQGFGQLQEIGSLSSCTSVAFESYRTSRDCPLDWYRETHISSLLDFLTIQPTTSKPVCDQYCAFGNFIENVKGPLRPGRLDGCQPVQPFSLTFVTII